MDRLCKFKKFIHRKLINGRIILLNVFLSLLTIPVVRRSVETVVSGTARAGPSGVASVAGKRCPEAEPAPPASARPRADDGGSGRASALERGTGRRRKPRLPCEAVFSRIGPCSFMGAAGFSETAVRRDGCGHRGAVAAGMEDRAPCGPGFRSGGSGPGRPSGIQGFSPSMVRRRGGPETGPVGGGPGPLSCAVVLRPGHARGERGRIEICASQCAGPGRLHEASGVPLRRRVMRASQDPHT